MNNINNPKRILEQCLCNHEGVWCRKRGSYRQKSKETIYLICRKCGKVLEERTARYS